MKYRGKFDGNGELIAFADTLEQVCVATVEAGHMTKDLALLVGEKQPYLTTTQFMDKIVANLDLAMRKAA